MYVSMLYGGGWRGVHSWGCCLFYITDSSFKFDVGRSRVYFDLSLKGPKVSGLLSSDQMHHLLSSNRGIKQFCSPPLREDGY